MQMALKLVTRGLTVIYILVKGSSGIILKNQKQEEGLRVP